jgi:hypothetical protein
MGGGARRGCASISCMNTDSTTATSAGATVRASPYRDAPTRSTAVVPSSQARYRWSISAFLLGLAAAGLAVRAAHADDPFLLGLLASLGGASAVGMFIGKVLRAPGHASCPECGARIDDLDRRACVQGILCRCGRFLDLERGRLQPTPPATIAERPIFGATRPDSFVWPSGCVVCGAPATQHLPIREFSTSLAETVAINAVGVAALATVGVGFTFSRGSQQIDVPHCQQHDDGVIAVKARGTGFALVFRSYASQRAFCVENDASSVEVPEAHRAV